MLATCFMYFTSFNNRKVDAFIFFFFFNSCIALLCSSISKQNFSPNWKMHNLMHVKFLATNLCAILTIKFATKINWKRSGAPILKGYPALIFYLRAIGKLRLRYQNLNVIPSKTFLKDHIYCIYSIKFMIIFKLKSDMQ